MVAAAAMLLDLDAFIIMPNHVHRKIILADESERRHAIPEIVRGFKTSPRAVSMNVPAGAVSCGNVAITSTSFAMRRRWIAFALTSRIILRGGRMTRRTSHERCLAKQGGFETRPYNVFRFAPCVTRYAPPCVPASPAKGPARD